jgi:hypothetical protein
MAEVLDVVVFLATVTNMVEVVDAAALLPDEPSVLKAWIYLPPMA